MRKIIGNTVGMGLPKPNLMQTDPLKGDYVYGKEEFLKDPRLKGDPGITPHIGPNGNWFIGNTDTGVKAKGEDGHTPEKGEDYNTEADKAEMVQAVLAALPTWEGGNY